MFWGATGRNDDREGGANNPIVLIATIILAPIAAMLIQMAISRSREFDADAGGAAIAGSPLGLVSALRKLDAASRAFRWTPIPRLHISSSSSRSPAPGSMSLFSTHPSTEARVAALMSLARQ